MLIDLGMEVSAKQVAKLYAEFLDIFIIDRRDEDVKAEIERMGVKVVVTDTVMADADKKLALARDVMTAIDRCATY